MENLMKKRYFSFTKVILLIFSSFLIQVSLASDNEIELKHFDPKTGMLGADFDDAMKNARIEFSSFYKQSKANQAKSVIITLPDPSDTRYMREFDLMLDAIMQAAAASNFSFISHYFPWKYTEGNKETVRINRRIPGVLLYEGEGEPLYIFIVGESPTKGIQHQALVEALNQVTKLNASNTEVKISILGPTYSGSIRSIGNSINSWVDDPLLDKSKKQFSFNFVSGTATGESNDQKIRDVGLNLGENIQLDYASTATSDKNKHDTILHFLNEKYGFTQKDIVTLVENTTFGSNVEKVNEEKVNEEKINQEQARANKDNTKINSRLKKTENQITTFPFPLHIAQIQVDRMAVDSEQLESKTQRNDSVRKYLKLEFDSTSQKSDIPLPYAPKMSSRSGELVVGEIMKKIRKTGAKVVGIVATDIRDQLFLVNEIKRIMPNIIVFTYEVDVLLAHPFYKKATKGMLVASSNRLENTGRAGKGIARFFSSDRAQGVFSAFLRISGRVAESKQSVIISSPSNSGIWILHDSSRPKGTTGGSKPMYIPSIWKVIYLFLLVATAAYIYSLWVRNRGSSQYIKEERVLLAKKQKTIRLKLYLSMATMPFLISLLISNAEMNPGMNIVIKTYWVIQAVAVIYFISSYLIESLSEVEQRFSKSSRMGLLMYKFVWMHWAIIKSLGTLLLFWFIMITAFFVADIPSDNADWLVRLISINSGVSPLLPLLLFSSVLIHYYWVQLSQAKTVEQTLYTRKNQIGMIPPVKILNSFVDSGVERRKVFIPVATTLILLPILYILFEYSGRGTLIFPLTMFEMPSLIYLANAGFISSLMILVTMSINYFMNYNQLMSFLEQTKELLKLEDRAGPTEESGFFKNIFADDTPFMMELVEKSEENLQKMAQWQQLKEEQRSLEMLHSALANGRGVNALLEAMTSIKKDGIKIEELTSLYCKDIKEHFVNHVQRAEQHIVPCDQLESAVSQLIASREKLDSALYLLFRSEGIKKLLKTSNEPDLLMFVNHLGAKNIADFKAAIQDSENLAELKELKQYITNQSESTSDVDDVKALCLELTEQELELAKRLLEHAKEHNGDVILDVLEEVRDAFKSSTMAWLKLFIPLLRKQLSFNIYSSIVILLGIMSYPFYPGQTLLTWVGCIVIIIAFISTNSIVQMDRDGVLSALFTKSRDKVGINNSFANGLARYSAAPISMVFLSQSQWMQDSLSQFIGPLLNSLFG